MRVYNTSFVANKAGVEGAGIMSIGYVEVLSNVSFSENAYYCRAGKYGYLEQNEARVTACRLCRVWTSFCRLNRTNCSSER